MVKTYEKGGVQELLRPIQIEETNKSIAALEKTAAQPHVQNPGRVRQQILSLKTQLDESAPKSYSANEIDAAALRERELREHMVADGMPTAREMRSMPPGAESKHRNWQNRNKVNINEWKHIQQRLNAGSEEYDISNIETFRPTGTSGQELSMDNAFISGQQFRLPPDGARLPVVITESEQEQLAELDSKLADLLVTLNNDQRAKVKEFLAELNNPKPKKPRKPMTQAHKDALALGRKKAAERRQAQEAATTG